MTTTQPINIIGAGLAGSLMSVYMAQKGYPVNIYERRSDPRRAGYIGGRSINLALSVRGMHALRETSMLDEVMEFAIPMYGRMMHDTEGNLTFQAYSRNKEECIYSVSRGKLNIALMNLAESMSEVNYHFDHRCDEIDLDSGSIHMTDVAREKSFRIEESHTLACDGAFSAIRYAMQKTPRFNYSQEYLAYGYKELTIPPGPDGGFQMEREALHIWPRGNYMMIALPNPDGSFTCTLFFPYEGEKSFAALDSDEKIMAFFQSEFGDAVPLIPNLLEEYHQNPTSSLVTIRCYPWTLEDKVALIGDASHAIVPFFGQGMNAAFEDCSVMSECIDAYAPDWQKVFDTYQKLRKENADAIADMALENFIEMRDTVADEEFLFRKKVEFMLGRTFEQYKSRYELVSFSRIPYAEAYQRGITNMEILKELTQGIGSLEDINLAKAEALIQAHIG
ncbi:MAG: NAD(P)/FAD-dependent oxidoreductase [Bacteroidota bacterium]